MYIFVLFFIISFLIIYLTKKPIRKLKQPTLFDNDIYIDENDVCYKYETICINN